MSHAILPPSGAERWMVCTPSARLEQNFDDRQGIASEEGTLAHSIGEDMIRRELRILSQSSFETVLYVYKKHPLFKPEMLVFCEEYKDYVMEVYNGAKTRTEDAMILVEEKIDLTAYVPEGYGTGDVQIIADGDFHFIDLKYGKGVPVSAERNKQLMLYALGCLRKWDLVYDIETVHLHIYQPRIDNISVYSLSASELRTWGNTEVKPKAKLAFAGEGEYIPGEKQCRFCKAKAVCRAFAEYNLELAKHDFKDAYLLSDEEISDILTRASLFKNWITAVEDYALLEAVHKSKQWPGYKIVEGRSNRKYTDQKEVAKVLNGAGILDFYKPLEVRGITDMTALLGKKKFSELLDPLILKPAGKPTLVPLSDKREPFMNAAAAFEDVDTDLDI